MCGIAGIVQLADGAPVQRDELACMAAALRHRGPDDEGLLVSPGGHCGQAFRRLAIIDLATGNQPIANETGDLHVVFNGEIYNFRELRRELASLGHVFRTQGDAEVIVHAFEEWGGDCFARFNGMFAVALWDERPRVAPPGGQLVLARDRFGKKPLVYGAFASRLHFASELKAILALPNAPRMLDPQSLHRYLLFQYVPAPHSILRGYHKLPPGHFAVLRPGDARPQVELTRYAALRPPAPETLASYDAALGEFGRRMRAAVERRLISDVPLGAFLSGGLDSSLVVALMRELGVSPLRTFSIRFEDARYDESAYARVVADRFQTEHHEHTVTPEAVGMLDTLAYHFDEPFADSSAIPTWYVSHYTRQHVTVALTGDAGDECFGGYDRYRAADLAGRLDWLPHAVRRGLSTLAPLIPHARAKSRANRLHRFLAAVGQNGPRRYLDWVNVFPPASLLSGYRPEFAQQLQLDEPLTWFDGLYDAMPPGVTHAPTPAQRAMHADLHSYLPYDLLTKVDLASMACSLECRAPFLDPHVVDFAFHLPAAWRRGKQFLRDWARPRLPAEILTRSKMGFGVPIGEWFRGPLRETLRERVLAADGVSRRLFRDDWLAALCRDHIDGKANHEHRLWALLMLELWAARWRPGW